MTQSPDSPGVAFPPPFLFVAGFLAAVVCDRWITHVPLATSDSVRPVVLAAGWGAVAAGFALAGWAFSLFFGAKTAIAPNRPARRLVRSGPYRFTRNPMDVSLTLIYLGATLIFNSIWPLLVLPIVLAALVQFVMRCEEAYLSRTFGDEYIAFRRDVRRWL